MAKKFFNKKVYNKRRNTIISFIIIFLCAVGVGICFIFTKNIKPTDPKDITIKLQETVDIEINSKEPESDIFFKELAGITSKEITVDYSQVSFDKLGTYDVNIIIKEKTYQVKLKIVDVSAPELVLKDVTIKKGDSYTAQDFVESCVDNSKNDCVINFYQSGIDPEGEIIDYAKFTKEGTYEIKVLAADYSNNEIIKTANLFIGQKTSSTTCKYGNLEYNTSYVLANVVGDNGCALDLNLYQNENTRKAINNIAATETKKIQMEVNNLPNLINNITINRSVNAILNNSGNGLVGYSLYIEVKDGDGKIVVSYYLNLDSKRIYVDNPYKLN